MKLPQTLLLRLSPLVEAARGEPLVQPYIELAEQPEAGVMLASPYGNFVFDRGQRVVLKDGVDVAQFDSIQSVDIAAFPGGRGARSWSITLYRGVVDRITVARTYDDSEASIVAARLARLLGCKVISLTGRR
jgi:hypothetical protein